jgi:hypothetical protein
MVLHFTDSTPAEVTAVLTKWMKNGRIMSIGAAGDEPGPHILVNWGHITLAMVNDTPPDSAGEDGLPVFAVSPTLEVMLEQLDDE